MNEHEIQELVQYGHLPHHQTCQELKQTHISWILLCEDFAYKIKKPLKLSFLDFSTLQKRKYFCEQELLLNQRLTHDIYLEVLPIMRQHNKFTVGGDGRPIVDYTVAMRRLDNSREMSKLLPLNQVGEEDINRIAQQLVAFHQSADIVNHKITPKVLFEDFEDIRQIKPFIDEQLGTEAGVQMDESISFVRKFIDRHADLIHNRDQQGFIRDCHGDLHSGNIFLLDEPVIFDCIEFDTHLRQIDILSELGFFCMDLEFWQHSHLSKHFVKQYNQQFPVIRNEQEALLFLFYKFYRANVKVKINAIKTMQAVDQEVFHSRLRLCQQYFDLFRNYLRMMQKPKFTLDF